jgi:AraC family ethanolamine operon transcriptional activator
MSHVFEIASFSGIEVLKETIRGSDVVPTQLSREPISGTLVRASVDGVEISFSDFCGRARVRGPLSLKEFIIGVVLKSVGPSSQWHFETVPGDIATVPRTEEHDAVYNGTQISWATLGIPLSDLLEIAAFERPEIADAVWKTPSMYRPSPAIRELIVDRYQTAVGAICKEPKILESPNAARALKDELIGVYLLGLAESIGHPMRPKRAFVSAVRTLARAEDYFRECQNNPPRIIDLCQKLQISRNTLFHSFSQVVGVSPGAYLTNWRLSQVRCALSNKECLEGVTVTDTALNWGFWELGRFSNMYKRLFGELPSETLKRTKGC